MKKIIFFLTAICVAVTSCTKDKTDYEAETGGDGMTEEYVFKEAYVVNSEGYTVRIEALNGTFYKGYNEVRLQVVDSQTQEKAKVTTATFLPVMGSTAGSAISCPHRYKLTGKVDDDYLSGYSVFTEETGEGTNWDFYISFTIGTKTYNVKQTVSVQEQPNRNLNMTTFTGKDNEQYYIALLGPLRPKVAENELVAGIYKYNKPTSSSTESFPDPAQFSYSEITGYTLKLDPRMPEPSMGNHSSINNKDLTQQDDGLYHGVVNYTMTGNWTLNFIMMNQDGKILRGTEVPKDFTPGVEGSKSELYIDILF